MPVDFRIVGIGIRVTAGVTEVLLLQQADGSFRLAVGAPQEGESAPLAAVRLVQALAGWQGTVLPGPLELLAHCDGQKAVGMLLVNCVSVQAPAAGQTPLWRSLAQAGADLATNRSQQDLGSMLAAVTRMVANWNGQLPDPNPRQGGRPRAAAVLGSRAGGLGRGAVVPGRR